jgi:UDP:flavonoid glycosyltransferase YjiC (YdhE family)
VRGKRIILTTWGSFGDLHPYMALALKLNRRGHDPVLGSIPLYKDKVEKAGIEFCPIRPDMPTPDQDPDLFRRALAPRTGAEVIMRELLMPHLEHSYQDTLELVQAGPGADMLITHPLTFGGHLVAEQTGIRWLSTVLSPMVFMSSFDPPRPPILPWLQHVSRLHPSLARLLVGAARNVSERWVLPVTRFRKQLGLPRRGHPLFDCQYSPQGTLAMYSSLLGRVQPDFPPNTRTTGFAFYDTDDDRGTMTPSLQKFLDDSERARERPILFTLGSSAIWSAGDFYRTSVDAVRQMKHRALLLVGDRQNLGPGPLPEGVAAFDYAPYTSVMPRCRAIVHQGGVGTTGQGLRSGRPMLCMPFGHDTLDNAQRAQELGLARTLPQKRFTVDRLVGELTELLENPRYQQRSEQIASEIRAEDGTNYACDLIEEMLERPTPAKQTVTVP